MKTTKKHADLDLFARMLKVFADTPWLHYGLWLAGETPSFPRVRQAQERYVDKLLALLPPAPASILDIGGGTGAMAGRLASLGYTVEMLTPSEVQVGIARETLDGAATVHLSRLEDFAPGKRFDVCLFSESYQYIPLAASFAKLGELLAPGGRVVIADCFRSEGFKGGRAIGGGTATAPFSKLSRVPALPSPAMKMSPCSPRPRSRSTACSIATCCRRCDPARRPPGGQASSHALAGEAGLRAVRRRRGTPAHCRPAEGRVPHAGAVYRQQHLPVPDAGTPGGLSCRCNTPRHSDDQPNIRRDRPVNETAPIYFVC
ncbi:class I SAM-dependent methyltransferase [Devosia insulae]|uniref:class I SAM-dependent methyltransferase n=1 Tax=Devosia insulae TaxID=408174 RepID=UPI0009FFECAA|nr:class I SAM-dependent methyltransferase [Devosia insulae]